MYPGVVQYWVKIVLANKLCQLYTILCVLCLYSVLRRAILVRYFFGPMFQALTCMFLELLKQLFPIFVLRDVANKKTVVIVRYGNTNSFPFLQLVIIQLKMHNSWSQDMRFFSLICFWKVHFLLGTWKSKQRIPLVPGSCSSQWTEF